MKEKKKLCGYYNYTVVLTYLGMLSGFTGILFASEGAFCRAMLCLMIAGVCDMFDGAIASTMKRNEREKCFGIQIDSLSDLICFGALPAVFVYQICHKSYLAFLAACFYILCALIRLAYFNVMEEERQRLEIGRRTEYLGLPVTTAALFLPLCFVLRSRMTSPFLGEAVFPCLLVIAGIAFLLPIPIKKPYLFGKIGIVVAGLAELTVLLMGMGLDV